jgi:hypothetical protein
MWLSPVIQATWEARGVGSKKKIARLKATIFQTGGLAIN